MKCNKSLIIVNVLLLITVFYLLLKSCNEGSMDFRANDKSYHLYINNVALHPLKPQDDNSDGLRYDWIYVLGQWEYNEAHTVIEAYLDSFQIDINRTRQEVTFLFYRTGMPLSSHYGHQYWLGAYTKEFMFQIEYSANMGREVTARQFRNGRIVKEISNSLNHVQKLGLGNFARSIMEASEYESEY